jgi:hypothetical protein
MGEIDSDLENFESKRARTRILIQRAIMKLTPAERGRWKFRLASLGLGVLAAGAVFAASLAVSDDLRLMYLVGVIVLFGGATWMGAKSWRDWLSPCLLYLPLAGMFGFFVLGQLPFLWPHLLLWALAIAIGLSLLVARLNRKAMISGVVILFAISVWYCMSYIPDRMKRATNHFGDGAAPEFAFRAVSEGAVPTTATPGKFCSSISSAPGVHLVSPSCQKLCESGRAYKTGATSNLLSWARTPVATPQRACAPSPGSSTLPFPSLSIREKKRTPHLV